MRANDVMRGGGAGAGAGALQVINTSLFGTESVEQHPGERNCETESAVWIWPVSLLFALESWWLGVRKTSGMGLFL